MTRRGTDVTRPTNRINVWLRVLLGLVVVGLIFVMLRMLPTEQFFSDARNRIDDFGVWSPLIFVLIYVVATVLLLPAWPLTVLAGAIWGIFYGTVLASIAATAGAAAAFFVARRVARRWVEKRLHRHPKFGAIDQALGQQGWKIVALTRLSPAIPFTWQNYLYGISSIRFVPYIATSWVAMLPGALMYAYIGSVGATSLELASSDVTGEGLSRDATAQWTLRIIGLVATVAVTIYITAIARRALARLEGSEE